jgi:hypothetical protein
VRLASNNHLLVHTRTMQTSTQACCEPISTPADEHATAAPYSHFQLYPGLASPVTVIEQCAAEQRYVRGAQLRSLLYNQVGTATRLRVLHA